MRLRLFDPHTGTSKELCPVAPSVIGVAAGETSLRVWTLGQSLITVMKFLGVTVVAGREVIIGGPDPGVDAAWLQVSPLEGNWPDWETAERKGFSRAHVCFHILRTHYRQPLRFEWSELGVARDEYARLLASAGALSDVAIGPSSSGRVAYLHRIREALCRDLDIPTALRCISDGLRPGALSPASRAALLRETLSIFTIK